MMMPPISPPQKAILAMSRAQYLRTQAGYDEDIYGNGPVDKVSVGVCIFRLDGTTLRPAVLLLRRSPRWWHHDLSPSERQKGGEWELPGGKVENSDFCIAAAIERLVREQTGLKVLKVLGGLNEMRWSTETKVLLWDDSDEFEDDEDEDSGRELVKVSVGMEIPVPRPQPRRACGVSDGGEDALAYFADRTIDIFGIRIAASSSSGTPPSPSPITPKSFDVPPPLPPKDYEYEHDASLEPAPLSLRTRDRPEKIKPMIRINTQQLTPEFPKIRPVPAQYRQLPDTPPNRRQAQIIPHKILRKKHVQLNFSVLVDESPESEPIPAFLVKGSNSGSQTEFEHDALDWATFSRVEGMPMNADLKQVVHQGLAWAGEFIAGNALEEEGRNFL
ncbi:hypothetical protein GGR57DRAFT_238795 [Xylariaceae sp. FL1272]|nr:hypothetical protein GGR57DRAFT_238795 [Xylariaceae sp. FL1272]